MTAWNELNTSGFSQDELAMLSNVYERLTRDLPGIDAANLHDLLNNEWHSGISEQEMVDAVTKRISAMRPLSEMLEHEIANEKMRLLNMPESEQTEETESRLEEILDWEEDKS